jgi:hypothetical protein
VYHLQVATRLKIVSDRRAATVQKEVVSSNATKKGANKKGADKKGADKNATDKKGANKIGAADKKGAEKPRKEKRKRGDDVAAVAVDEATDKSEKPRGEKRKRGADDESADGEGGGGVVAGPVAGPSAPKRRNTEAGDGKMEEGKDGEVVVDTSAYPRTVFLKNLSFNSEEPQIKEVFAVCGTIEEVRLVRNSFGKSKGFAYVQFESEESVVSALAMDRHSSSVLDFRPVYVNKCEERKPDAPATSSGPTCEPYPPCTLQ